MRDVLLAVGHIARFRLKKGFAGVRCRLTRASSGVLDVLVGFRIRGTLGDIDPLNEVPVKTPLRGLPIVLARS